MTAKDGGGSRHGLPAPLPPGERILWQGKPDWRMLARQTFHLRVLAAYFAALLLWRVVVAFENGGTLLDMLDAAMMVVGFALVAVGILSLIARAIARTSLYTVTDRRIILCIGVALEKTINIPFGSIVEGSVKTFADGSGNIRLRLKTGDVVPYLVLWPHVYPWRFGHPEPMLRAVPDANTVVETVARAISAVGPRAFPTEAKAGRAMADGGARPTAQPVAHPSRLPLVGALAMVVLCLVTVGAVRLGHQAEPQTAMATAEALRDLTFQDLGGDRIAILDADAGDTIAVIEPGQDGLVRSAMRGLERARSLGGIGPTEPYRLLRWDGGRVTLSDLRTDRHIALTSFRGSETSALARLVALADGPR